MPELIEIEAARALVVERCRRLPSERVRLRDALGRTLAEDVAGAEPVPGFDNSAMDGFAIRAADTEGASADSPAVLRVVDESRAGSPAGAAVGEGEAIRISTGAMLPAGADAVVRVEDTSGGDGRVEVRVPVDGGRDIRRAGEDIEPGERVIGAGTPIGPAELGVLASVGIAEVACARRPRVHVLTTGDELREPWEDLAPGAIRNSNSYTVHALAERSGAEVVATETVGDDAGATRAAIERALGADVAVICGGLSMGEHDHVRPVLAELGVEQTFWGVALRPGKPTWLGTTAGGGLVFGLPGNPVSAMVTFLLFARPAITAMLGRRERPWSTSAILDRDYGKRPGRADAVRVRLEAREDGWHAVPTKDQDSHILTSMLGADALAMIPTDSGDVPAGERVQIELLPGAAHR